MFLLQEIIYCYGETMSTVGVISKVFSFLDRTPKCRKNGELAPDKLQGRIVFQNVTYTYSSASQPVLKVNMWQFCKLLYIEMNKFKLSRHKWICTTFNYCFQSVSMELKPGKMTALVGPSGSGKTSCVSLLKRLYEPQEGQILLDGEPLHQYKHKYLHQKVKLPCLKQYFLFKQKDKTDI